MEDPPVKLTNFGSIHPTLAPIPNNYPKSTLYEVFHDTAGTRQAFQDRFRERERENYFHSHHVSPATLPLHLSHSITVPHRVAIAAPMDTFFLRGNQLTGPAMKFPRE